MRNTIYGLAQEHLTQDLEAFAAVLAEHFLSKEMVFSVEINLKERRWARQTGTGFLGGGSERRVAAVTASDSARTATAGIEGLVVLKTGDRPSPGFPATNSPFCPKPMTAYWPLR